MRGGPTAVIGAAILLTTACVGGDTGPIVLMPEQVAPVSPPASTQAPVAAVPQGPASCGTGSNVFIGGAGYCTGG